MKLLTKADMTKLIKNGVVNSKLRDTTGETFDFRPVVKFFGGGACTWLISEVDPTNQDIAFGLCDLGHGSPEMGYVSIKELSEIKFPPFGLSIERDMHFTADKTLTEYADDARANGRINA